MLIYFFFSLKVKSKFFNLSIDGEKKKRGGGGGEGGGSLQIMSLLLTSLFRLGIDSPVLISDGDIIIYMHVYIYIYIYIYIYYVFLS